MLERCVILQTEQHQLGASGIAIPPLGVGVWSWGERGFWGYGKAYTESDVFEAYRVCLDAGLNFFDTAEVYGGGDSERLLGACSRSDDRPIIIASKFAPLPTRLSGTALLKALDASLERLERSSIDLYQVHWPYSLLRVDTLMDALAQAVRAGKIRAVGVSNYSAGLMRQAHARLARHNIPLASNQVHFSLLHRKPETNKVLATCRELNVALIAYSPLEQGLLTGKYRVNASEPVAISGPRRFTPLFRSSQRRQMEPLFEMLTRVAEAHEKTVGQTALAWLMQTDPLVTPIPGAKNARQARENAGAIGWQMTPAEHEQIGRAAQPWLR